MANTKKFRDEEIYRLSDSGLSLQEICDKMNAPYATVSMVVGHGRQFGLCLPMTNEQKRARSKKSRMKFLAKYYAGKA